HCDHLHLHSFPTRRSSDLLGDHVAQKGSFVSSEVLRFDFSHFSKVTEGELREINRIVNEKIRQNIVVKTEEMSKENALRFHYNRSEEHTSELQSREKLVCR